MSLVVSFCTEIPGEEVIAWFEWAASRVLSLELPIVTVKEVGALAKSACDTTSSIHVRLYSAKDPIWGILAVSGQFSPE
jgi:hypothetical protein